MHGAIVHFFGRQFLSDERACLVRPYTEVYVRTILDDWRDRECRIIECGCGAGAVITTLALELTGTFFGIDNDRRALSLATENAGSLGACVEFLHSDLLCSVDGDFDAIYANLPFEVEDPQNPVSAQPWEPRNAIYDSTGTRLGLLSRFLADVSSRLRAEGLLYMEIPADAASKALFTGHPISVESGEVVGKRMTASDILDTVARFKSEGLPSND